MYNKILLIGRLGQNPELRYTPSGTPVCNFSLATERRFRDKTTDAIKKDTTWHDVICWNNQAEFLGELGRKGQLVFVEGELQKQKWTDKDGVQRTKAEVNAKVVRLLEYSDGEADGDD